MNRNQPLDGVVRLTDLGRRRSFAAGVLIHAGLVVVIAFFGAPFLWILAAAFDHDAPGGRPWPSAPTLANFTGLFRELDFAVPLRNSLIVASATMVLTTVAVALAGYALSRLTFRGQGTLAVGVLLLQALPLSATMVPIYDLCRRLGLRNSYLGLVLAHAAIALPLLIWLMKGFFDAVPRELEEAAWLDGGSRPRAWAGVLLPAVRPGLAVVAGFAFIGAWAEALLVLILVDDPGKQTVALAFYQVAQNAAGVGTLAAMAVLYVLPVVALVALIRGELVRGLVGGPGL